MLHNSFTENLLLCCSIMAYICCITIFWHRPFLVRLSFLVLQFRYLSLTVLFQEVLFCTQAVLPLSALFCGYILPVDYRVFSCFPMLILHLLNIALSIYISDCDKYLFLFPVTIMSLHLNCALLILSLIHI